MLNLRDVKRKLRSIYIILFLECIKTAIDENFHVLHGQYSGLCSSNPSWSVDNDKNKQQQTKIIDGTLLEVLTKMQIYNRIAKTYTKLLKSEIDFESKKVYRYLAHGQTIYDNYYKRIINELTKSQSVINEFIIQVIKYNLSNICVKPKIEFSYDQVAYDKCPSESQKYFCLITNFPKTIIKMLDCLLVKFVPSSLIFKAVKIENEKSKANIRVELLNKTKYIKLSQKIIVDCFKEVESEIVERVNLTQPHDYISEKDKVKYDTKNKQKFKIKSKKSHRNLPFLSSRSCNFELNRQQEEIKTISNQNLQQKTNSNLKSYYTIEDELLRDIFDYFEGFSVESIAMISNLIVQYIACEIDIKFIEIIKELTEIKIVNKNCLREKIWKLLPRLVGKFQDFICDFPGLIGLIYEFNLQNSKTIELVQELKGFWFKSLLIDILSNLGIYEQLKDKYMKSEDAEKIEIKKIMEKVHWMISNLVIRILFELVEHQILDSGRFVLFSIPYLDVLIDCEYLKESSIDEYFQQFIMNNTSPYSVVICITNNQFQFLTNYNYFDLPKHFVMSLILCKNLLYLRNFEKIKSELTKEDYKLLTDFITNLLKKKITENKELLMKILNVDFCNIIERFTKINLFQ